MTGRKVSTFALILIEVEARPWGKIGILENCSTESWVQNGNTNVTRKKNFLAKAK